MAITIEANYSKKLGLPQYSSHQYSVSVRTEVSDLSQIPTISGDLYRQLQEVVDRDIQRPGFLPGDPQTQHTRQATQAPRTNWPTTPSSWACSDKQRELIKKLMRENGIDNDEVEKIARVRFGKDLCALNKLQASGLIDELMDACRSKQGGRK